MDNQLPRLGYRGRYVDGAQVIGAARSLDDLAGRWMVRLEFSAAMNADSRFIGCAVDSETG